MGRAKDQPLALLSGGLVGKPAVRAVVGNSGKWRPRDACGMPYTAEFKDAFRSAAEHDVAVGCATGAREIVAVAPAGCACGAVHDSTKPAGCGCAGKVAPSGASPTLPLLVPAKDSPMTTAPAAGPLVQFPDGSRPATISFSAAEEAAIIKLRLCADNLVYATTAQREFFANEVTRLLDGAGAESWRFASAAVAFQLGQGGSPGMADQFFHAIRGRDDMDYLVDQFCRISSDARANNYAKVQLPTGVRTASLKRADWSTSSPVVAKAPVKPAGKNSPLGLIAPTVRQRENAVQRWHGAGAIAPVPEGAGQTKALDMVRGRWAGAGVVAPTVTGAPPSSAVPVMGSFTQAQCHQPASWYTEPPLGAFTNCYAADIAAARQAENAARGGSSGGSTATGPITSSADCTARGGVAYNAVRDDGTTAPACIRADGVKEWIGSGGQSDTSTVQVIGTIANAVGSTTRDILSFISQENNRDLQETLARMENATRLQIAAMSQNNAALAANYQQQANNQQQALITMLSNRLGQQAQQGSFQQMLPMLALGALAIGGAYVLTRR